MKERTFVIAEEIRNGIPQGMTLQSIGDKFGISRERVRQIGRKFGLETSHWKFCDNAQARESKAVSDRYFAKNGMTKEKASEINEKYGHRVRDRFVSQRNNANKRGIEWNLTFGEWWSIWENHYDKRGKGVDRLCMCRYFDVGSYELGNVYIATHSQNIKDYYIIKKILEISRRLC